MTTLTLDLPSHWACYLINGDDSGLEPTEVAEIQACLSRQEVGSCIDCSTEESFRWHHDATADGVLAANCLTYTFIVL